MAMDDAATAVTQQQQRARAMIEGAPAPTTGQQAGQHWSEQLAAIAHQIEAHRRATEHAQRMHVVGQLGLAEAFADNQRRGELVHTRRGPLRPWRGVRAEARREPDGSWRGALWVPTRSGDVVVRAEVPSRIVQALCAGSNGVVSIGHGRGCVVSGAVITGFDIGAGGIATAVPGGARAKGYPAGYGSASWQGGDWEDEDEEEAGDEWDEAEEMAGLEIGFFWFIPLIAAGIAAAAGAATAGITAASRPPTDAEVRERMERDRRQGGGAPRMMLAQTAQGGAADPRTGAAIATPYSGPISPPPGAPQNGYEPNWPEQEEEEDWVEGWSVGAGGGGSSGAGGAAGGGGFDWGSVVRGATDLAGAGIRAAGGAGGGSAPRRPAPRRPAPAPRRAPARTPARTPARPPAAARPPTGRQAALQAAQGGQLNASQIQQLVAQLGAGSLLSDAGEQLGVMSPALARLLRGSLRAVDAQAASMIGDPAAVAALRAARQSTEGRVQAALRIADALLELTTPR
jgi:hypothetical protein